jgi:hypothetical protein
MKNPGCAGSLQLRFARNHGGTVVFDGRADLGEDLGMIGGAIEALGRVMPEMKEEGRGIGFGAHGIFGSRQDHGGQNHPIPGELSDVQREP